MVACSGPDFVRLIIAPRLEPQVSVPKIEVRALCRGLPTSMGRPMPGFAVTPELVQVKIHRHQLPARSVLAPKHMENAKIHFCYIGILPVLERMLVFPLSTGSANSTGVKNVIRSYPCHAAIWLGGFGRARSSVQPEHKDCVTV